MQTIVIQYKRCYSISMNKKTLKIIDVINIVMIIIFNIIIAGSLIYESILLSTLKISTKTFSIHLIQHVIIVLCISVPFFFLKFNIKIGEITKTLYLLFVFFAIWVGSIINIYDKFKYFDIIIHLFSGILISIISFSLIQQQKSRAVQLLLVVSITVFIGVLWEFYEFSFDNLLNLNMQRTASPYTGEAYIGKYAIFDTMLDLFSDFIGGLLGGLFITLKKDKQGFLIYKIN